jgi:hypothetical protein
MAQPRNSLAGSSAQNKHDRVIVLTCHLVQVRKRTADPPFPETEIVRKVGSTEASSVVGASAIVHNSAVDGAAVGFGRDPTGLEVASPILALPMAGMPFESAPR